MKKLLSSTAFLIVNKTLARKIGLNGAVLLADLISKEEYFIQSGGVRDGWFFNTSANIFEDTSLTPYQQRNAIKTLKKYQLIEVKLKGVPPKQNFKINEVKLLEIINSEETAELNVKKLNNQMSTNCTSINKNKQIRITNNTLTIRLAEFEAMVLKTDYTTAIKKDFINYWAETNPKGTKMKWEMQKTFDVKRRLARWQKNEKTWYKPKKNNNTTAHFHKAGGDYGDGTF